MCTESVIGVNLMCEDVGGSEDGRRFGTRSKRKKANSIGNQVQMHCDNFCLDARLHSTRGVVQMLNTISKIHKQKQIENKEAVPATKDIQTDTTTSSEDGQEVRTSNFQKHALSAQCRS